MKTCDICGKTKQTGHKVSHSNIKTKRSFDINVQSVRVNTNGTVKTIKACTRCIKGNKIVKAE